MRDFSTLSLATSGVWTDQSAVITSLERTRRGNVRSRASTTVYEYGIIESRVSHCIYSFLDRYTITFTFSFVRVIHQDEILDRRDRNIGYSWLVIFAVGNCISGPSLVCLRLSETAD